MIFMFLRMKILLPIFLALVCLISCQRTQPIPQDTLIVGVESFPKTLDPRMATDAMSSKICRLIYRGLFQLNDHLEIVPDLAQSYEWESATRLRISIKPNIIFQDGDTLSSEDIKATFHSIIEKFPQSPQYSNLAIIQNIDTPDAETVVFNLKEPFAPFLTTLTLGILPSSIAYGADFSPIGAGPFKVARIVDSQQVELERYDRAESPAKIQHLIFRTILEDTLRTMELMKGRLDLVQNAVPYQLLPAIQKEPHLKLTVGPGINFSYIGFNFKQVPLGNPQVRRALAMGINREDIIKYKMGNLAATATSLLSPQHWAYDSTLQPFSYQPEEAKKLLDQAGFPDSDGDGPATRFTLTYKTSSKKDRVDMALLIAEQLKKIGVNVEVKSYEWGTFFRDIRSGNFEMFSLTWVGLTEPDIYYWAFHSSQVPPVGANRGYYQNPQLDTLLESARRETSPTLRKEMYRRIQEIIYEGFPYVPLWYEQNWVVAQDRVQGYSTRPDAGFQNLVNVWKE